MPRWILHVAERREREPGFWPGRVVHPGLIDEWVPIQPQVDLADVAIRIRSAGVGPELEDTENEDPACERPHCRRPNARPHGQNAVAEVFQVRLRPPETPEPRKNEKRQFGEQPRLGGIVRTNANAEQKGVEAADTDEHEHPREGEDAIAALRRIPKARRDIKGLVVSKHFQLRHRPGELGKSLDESEHELPRRRRSRQIDGQRAAAAVIQFGKHRQAGRAVLPKDS